MIRKPGSLGFSPEVNVAVDVAVCTDSDFS